MARKDDFDFDIPDNNEKSPIHLKWWHSVLIVVGVLVITLAISFGALIAGINDAMSDEYLENSGIGDGNEDGGLDDTPTIEGIVTSIGTFLPKSTQEYILCEYTEYFSGDSIKSLLKPNDVLHNYKAYYLLFLENGEPYYQYSGEYTGEKTPEGIKAEILAELKENFKYSDENLAQCDVHIYQPVSFTRVTISEVTLTDTDVTVKYSAGAVDGEMSEEYTLTGTYTKADNDYTFTYTNLPEDENLLHVAENLLGTAKYQSYAQYGAWVNELTFGDGYKLTLVTPTE